MLLTMFFTVVIVSSGLLGNHSQSLMKFPRRLEDNSEIDTSLETSHAHSMATWDEIKQLASNFHQLQFTSASHRISERNCIEIIYKLAELDILRVYHTTDRSSFVTAEEIGKEIYEVLAECNGRVALDHLRKEIGVADPIVDTIATRLVQEDDKIVLYKGQLMNSEYTRWLIVKLSDLAREKGCITLAEFSEVCDLPIQYLSTLLQSELMNYSSLFLDDNVLYDQSFVVRVKAMIRGYFSASVKPVPLLPFISQLKISEQLFLTLANDLISSDRLFGLILPGSSTYVPHVYTHAQDQLIRTMFQQNRYVTFDSVRQFNVPNPKVYLQKLLPDAIHLSASSIASSVEDSLLALVEECIRSESWMDLNVEFHIPLNSIDLNQIIGPIMAKFPNTRLYIDSVVVSEPCFDKCQGLFDPIIWEKAKVVCMENPDLVLQLLERDNVNEGVSRSRNKKSESPLVRIRNSSASSNKGSCDRNQKRMSSKNNHLSNKHSPSPCRRKKENSTSLSDSQDYLVSFLTIKEVEKTLQDFISDEAPKDFISELAFELWQPLCKRFNLFLLNHLRSTGLLSNDQLKAKIEKTVSSLLSRIRLYERGTLLMDQSTQSSLNKHILLHDGGELVNQLFTYLAEINSLKAEDIDATNKLRTRLLPQLEPDVRQAILDLESTVKILSTSLSSLDEFYCCLDRVAVQLGLMLRSVSDKKQDRLVSQEISGQLQSRLLAGRLDSWEILHTTCSLIFQSHSGLPLSATCPADCLPAIFDWLRQYLTPEEHAYLTEYLELINKTETNETIKKKRILEIKLIEMGSAWKSRARSVSKEATTFVN